MGAAPSAIDPRGGDAGPPQADGGQYSAKAFRHYRPARIALQSYDLDSRYLDELHAAPGKQGFAVYMENRPRYARSPEFFLDCAEFFFDRQESDLAIQVLSNLAELESDDTTLRRLLAYRLARAAAYDLAVEALEEVLRLRPEEPQSYRDLALVLAQRADAARLATKGHRASHPQTRGQDVTPIDEQGKARIRSDYARAVDLLTEIVVRRWDVRFAEIELPALVELNRILAAARRYGVKPKGLDRRLIRLLDLDLRIVLTWQPDNAGLDLIVAEPSGQKASSSHERTTIGGLVSRRLAVCGPEEYLVRRAMNGKYVIQASRGGAARSPEPVTVYVDIFTNFGRDNEQHRSIAIRLKEQADTVTLGQVKF